MPAFANGSPLETSCLLWAFFRELKARLVEFSLSPIHVKGIELQLHADDPFDFDVIDNAGNGGPQLSDPCSPINFRFQVQNCLGAVGALAKLE